MLANRLNVTCDNTYDSSIVGVSFDKSPLSDLEKLCLGLNDSMLLHTHTVVQQLCPNTLIMYLCTL